MAIVLTRNLGVTAENNLASEQIIAVPLLYLNFPDKDPAFPDNTFNKYYAGALQNIVLGANNTMPAASYIGVGGISTISSIEESIELKATKLQVTLNGIDSTYVALVLAENYYGGEAKLALQLLDFNYNSLSGTDPVILFKGFMSVLSVEMDQNKANITVEIESILADWERPRVRRYNTSTQRLVDEADRGFDNVANVVSKEVVWKG